MELIYSKSAARDLRKLPKAIAKRIHQKLSIITNSGKSPYDFAVKLTNLPYHRIRIGVYRAIFTVEKDNSLIILKIAHRKEIYK